MSQLDALNDLRTHRPAAPAELRTRVHAIAVAAGSPPRRITWRRATLVLVPLVLAVVGGAVLASRDRSTPATAERGAPVGVAQKSAPTAVGAATLDSAAAPAPSATRLQNYDATLRLRVRGAEALSDATKRAVRIATSLGGFASVVHVDVHGHEGDATLRLRVPVSKVQLALTRLAELGTITGESVSIQDVQPAVNATDRRIARLQRSLRALRLEPRTAKVQHRIDALTAQVERLQRARRNAVAQARLATLQVELTTRRAIVEPKPHEDGPLHGAVVALRWLGVAALYALIVGGPVAAAAAAAYLAWRGLRRRAERRLLERA